jgi:ubiquinone/menaquinone biosynthesis C-methylase UbiE
MNGDAAGYIGSIPQDYDRSLGPLIFADYAADISHRVAACNPARVLETAAGTGIVTRRLRDVLPVSVRLTATDLNPPMLEIARTKFRAGEQVDFQPADATELPFADSSFDVVVCQFGVMFFPDKDKDKSYREVYRVLTHGGHYMFNIWDSHRHNPFGRIAHEVTESFFPADPPQFQSVPFAARLGLSVPRFNLPPRSRRRVHESRVYSPENFRSGVQKDVCDTIKRTADTGDRTHKRS